MSALSKDLKKRGVDFAIEKGSDGLTHVHFKGADVDTMQHGFKMAQARLEKQVEHKQTRSDVAAKIKEKGDCCRFG
ncbi:DUF3801 domain-containing protein [Arcanobacterium ihumii]|uniref:DUF3801 domain-containing protein n=1 Tax=Arcanobacterium ihumii TaxID=2138162 RepID=UPI0013589CCC|nr:DUF3801 domain-containing protein [Arcanobacterium ihumii]